MLHRKRMLSILLLVSSLMLLSGCIGTYSFDFIEEGDFVNNDGSWYLDSAGHSFRMEGLWMVDTYLTAPYGYKGDFTCTYEFFVHTAAGSEIDWMNFILIDNAYRNGVPVNKFFGFTIHRYGLATEYSVWQGAVDWDYHNVDLMPPGMEDNDVNVLVLKKTGNQFSATMNDIPIYTMTIKPANNTEYWYPAISGTYEYSLPYGIFFRKLTVQYTKGNEIVASWAFV